MTNVNTNAFGVPTYQYQIRLPGIDFEGPLDLLLQVIERNELTITEIALARIADEYVSYINQLTEINPAELAEFLVIAARLLLIKSQALLPLPPSRSGDGEDAPSAAEELLAQLREYKQVKDAAAALRERQENGLRSFSSQRIGPNEAIMRQVNSDLQAMGAPPVGIGGMKLNDLLALVKRRLASQKQQQLKLPMEASPQELKRLVRSVKIEDKIQLLETRLNEVETQAADSAQSRYVEFTSLFDPETPPSSVEVIVTFMAVLELVRRRKAQTRQDDLFNEIYIERIEPPVYAGQTVRNEDEEDEGEI
ncbi:MAG TPA: segregation/condensation protein A [Chloroflexia bacterium]|nr:segregation/condensation protein A [Chloroflexia bacterium]